MKATFFTVLPLLIAITACGGGGSTSEAPQPPTVPDVGNEDKGTDDNGGISTGTDNSQGGDSDDQNRQGYELGQSRLSGEFDFSDAGSLSLPFVIHDYNGWYEIAFSSDSGYSIVPLFRTTTSESRTSETNSTAVSLNYVPMAEYCGDYRLALDLKVYSQGKEYQENIPVNFSITSHSQLYSLSPNELYQSTASNIFLTGCSLDKVEASQLVFLQGDTEVALNPSQLQIISPYQLVLKNVDLGPGRWNLVLTEENGILSSQNLNIYSDELIGFPATMSWKEDNDNQVKRFGWNNDRGELHLLMDGTFFLASPFAAQNIRAIYPTGERTDLFNNVSDVASRVTSEGRTTAYMLSNGTLYSVPVGFMAPTEIPLNFGELKVKQPKSLTLLADQSLLLTDKQLGAVLIDLKRNHAVVLSDLNKLNAARFVAIEGDNKILAISKSQISLYNINTQEVTASYQSLADIDIENVKLAQSGKHIVLSQQGQFELLDLNLDELSSFELNRFDVGNDYSADVSADGQYLYLATEDPVFDKNTRVYQLAMNELTYSGIDMLAGDPAMTLIPDIGSGRQLAISKSGKTLALVGDKGLEIFYQSRF